MAIHVKDIKHIEVELLIPKGEDLSHPVKWSDGFRSMFDNSREDYKSKILLELNEVVTGRYQLLFSQIPADTEMFDAHIYVDNLHDYKAIKGLVEREFPKEVSTTFHRKFEDLVFGRDI